MSEQELNEANVDVSKIIKDLGDTDWGADNDAQLKAVQLLKGLSLSDDPKSNEFMKALSSASTGIAKKVLGGSVEEKKDYDKDDEEQEGKKVESISEEQEKLLSESMENIHDQVSKYL